MKEGIFNNRLCWWFGEGMIYDGHYCELEGGGGLVFAFKRHEFIFVDFTLGRMKLILYVQAN